MLSTLSCNYEVITTMLKITNASQTKQDWPLKTLLVFLPLITTVTLFRISFAFVAVFFLKAWSLIPMSALITLNLTRKGTNSFKES